MNTKQTARSTGGPTQTLRDIFAGQALIGILSSVDRIDIETWMKGVPHRTLAEKFAHDAFMTADAMIREREKQ